MSSNIKKGKIKIKQVALIFAYLMGTICMVTAVLLIIVQSKSSKKKRDGHFENEDRQKSPEQISSTSVSTAHSLSTHLNYGTIELSPQVDNQFIFI